MTSSVEISELTERERVVLEAVIRTFVETAEPTGSRTIAKRFDLGVSAATIRNTMSDLEERGYLSHPHTSAGRVPTDRAYRVYVDGLMETSPPSASESHRVREELVTGGYGIEALLRKAADVLSVLTQELGLAVAPEFDDAVLERLELVKASHERLLMILVLKGGAARTVFIELREMLPGEALAGVAHVLNERLAGLSLREIRATLRQRLRDAGAESGARELLNIFIEEADHIFELGPRVGSEVVLGSAQMLVGQPEFHSNEQMRNLLEITERRDVIRHALERRHPGITVTIGGEHVDPRLSQLTIVTSTYECGPFSGMLGVIGPTRMPYHKVLALVEHTSRMLGELIG
jgi:heat-inducible transcriptional repressor